MTRFKQSEPHTFVFEAITVIFSSNIFQVRWLRFSKSWEDSSDCYWWRVPSPTGNNIQTPVYKPLSETLLARLGFVRLCLALPVSTLLSWSLLHGRKTNIVRELAPRAQGPSGFSNRAVVVAARCIVFCKHS